MWDSRPHVRRQPLQPFALCKFIVAGWCEGDVCFSFSATQLNHALNFRSRYAKRRLMPIDTVKTTMQVYSMKKSMSSSETSWLLDVECTSAVKIPSNLVVFQAHVI